MLCVIQYHTLLSSEYVLLICLVFVFFYLLLFDMILHFQPLTSECDVFGVPYELNDNQVLELLRSILHVLLFLLNSGFGMLLIME